MIHPHIQTLHLKQPLMLAISYWFQSFTKIIDRSIYLTHNLCMKFSKQVLFLHLPVINLKKFTSTHQGFLLANLCCYASRYSCFFAHRLGVCRLVATFWPSEKLGPPPLAPKLWARNSQQAWVSLQGEHKAPTFRWHRWYALKRIYIF